MRADGKRVRNLDPYFEIIPYIMSKRYDAQNMFKAEIPMPQIEEYLRAKRAEGHPVSRMSLVIAAYIRLASQNSHLNRFIVNKRIFSRNHFCVTFVVLKKNLTTGKHAPTVVKAFFNLDETIFEVEQKIADIIDNNREIAFENPMDKLLKGIFRVPGLVSFAVGAIKFADKLGLLPRSIIDGSPFHTSLFLTNMASLRTNYIYHHLYEFGTTTVFISMGTPKTKTDMVDGSPKEVKYMPLGVVTDERICDGDYYSRCFRELERYLHNPSLLETRPVKVCKEIPW